MSGWDAAFADDLAGTIRRGPARPPATLTEVVAAEWDAAGLSTAGGVSRPITEASGELEEAFGRTTGRNAADVALERGPALYTMSPRRRAAFLSGLVAELPDDQRKTLAPLADVEARAREKAMAVEARSADVSDRSTGLTASAIGFVVGAARQVADPLNLATIVGTAPIGGGAAMGLGRFLLREAVAGAAGQAVQEPFIQPERAALGLEAGLGEAAKSVAFAGVGGAGFAGLLRGGAALMRRDMAGPIPQVEQMPGAGGRKPPDVSPDDLEAVALRVERDQVMDGSAHDPSAEGVVRSTAATDQAADALERGAGPSPTEAEPAGPARLVTAKRANAPRFLSINQFIARNGGIEMSGEAMADDLDKLFVPGGGRLARQRGRSIDGYWREKLIEAGYLRPDEDGGAARDIRDELFEAIRRDRTGDRVYTEADARDMAYADRRPSGYEREVEQQARALRKQFRHMYPDGIDEGALYDAAERVMRGTETNPLRALDLAFIEAEKADTIFERSAPAAKALYDDIPFPDRSAPETGGLAGRSRGEAGGTGEGGAEPGPAGAAGGPRPDGADAGGPLPREGEEPLLHGFGPVGTGERLAAAAGKPLRGGDAPPPAGGLFDRDARAQTDLVDTVAAARRADVDRALAAAGGDMTVPMVGPDGSVTMMSARALLDEADRAGLAADELMACILKGGG